MFDIEINNIARITERVLGHPRHETDTEGWTEYNCPYCADFDGDWEQCPQRIKDAILRKRIEDNEREKREKAQWGKNRDYRMNINESVKGGDMKNIVPQSIAEKFGFQPEYTLGNNIELWGANLNQIDYSPKELLRLLGISDFTSYNINGKVRITVKSENKMKGNTKHKPFHNDIWDEQYRDNRGYKFLSKGSGPNKQWKREKISEAQLRRIVENVVSEVQYA